jgi:hypothetical protein
VSVRGLPRVEIALHPRLELGAPRRALRWGAVPPRRVHGCELTARARHQRTADQSALCAQQRPCPPDVTSRWEGVTPKGSARLVSGPPRLEPPPQCHLARCRLLQAPARPEAGQRAVHGEREPGARMRARAPGGRGHGVAQAQRCKGKRIAKHSTATHRGIGGAISSKPWPELERFVAVRALAVAPSGRTLRNRHPSKAL